MNAITLHYNNECILLCVIYYSSPSGLHPTMALIELYVAGGPPLDVVDHDAPPADDVPDVGFDAGNNFGLDDRR